MGFISELADFFDKFCFWKKVKEWEQGLYIRNGIVLERTIKFHGEELEAIVNDETMMRKAPYKEGNYAIGLLYWVMPYTRPELPEGFKRSFWTALPINLEGNKEEERKLITESSNKGLFGLLKYLNTALSYAYWMCPHSKHDLEGTKHKWQRNWLGLPVHPLNGVSKVLLPGLYFFIPGIDEIVTDFKQERMLNLGYISVPTTDKESKNVFLSCNVRYQLIDFYDAYTKVHDYEVSLKDYTLAMLAKQARGFKYHQLKDPETIEKLEKHVVTDLRRIANKWGLKVSDVYITDNIAGTIQRIVHDGSLPAAHMVPAEVPKAT